MKIEIGESLIYSWLRHIKMCQLAQTNWKPSPQWTLHEQDKLDEFMRTSKDFFQVKYDYQIYKENKGVLQFLQQAEIDVLGVNVDDAETSCFAVDIAFHLGGTNYGSKKVTVERIVKKLLRSAMCLCGNIGFKSGEIIFASPKITPAVMTDLKDPLADINRMLRKIGFNFNVNIIANQEFFEQIMTPVLKIQREVDDTTELFLRSCQLIGMFERSGKVDKQVFVREGTDRSSAAKSSKSNGKPFKKYILHGQSCDAREMHTALVQATEAKRTIFYKDGRTHTDIWDTSNYTANSNLTSNLASGPLRDWNDKAIIGIEVEIN
jgi:hypothetical protein